MAPPPYSILLSSALFISVFNCASLHLAPKCLDPAPPLLSYPSGYMAVCQSCSGLSCGGFYTNVFSDTMRPVVLATVTAFGHGTVTHLHRWVRGRCLRMSDWMDGSLVGGHCVKATWAGYWFQGVSQFEVTVLKPLVLSVAPQMDAVIPTLLCSLKLHWCYFIIYFIWTHNLYFNFRAFLYSGISK